MSVPSIPNVCPGWEWPQTLFPVSSLVFLEFPGMWEKGLGHPDGFSQNPMIWDERRPLQIRACQGENPGIPMEWDFPGQGKEGFFQGFSTLLLVGQGKARLGLGGDPSGNGEGKSQTPLGKVGIWAVLALDGFPKNPDPKNPESQKIQSKKIQIPKIPIPPK